MALKRIFMANMHYWSVPGFIGRKEREVYLFEVVAAVCEYYEMSKEELMGRCHGERGTRKLVHPRQMVYWFMDRYGKMKLEEQARFFNYPYKSVVPDSVAAVERRVARKDLDTLDAISFIQGRLFGFGSGGY